MYLCSFGHVFPEGMNLMNHGQIMMPAGQRFFAKKTSSHYHMFKQTTISKYIHIKIFEAIQLHYKNY